MIIVADHVFPEDGGTGAAQGDFMDAANFASLAYSSDKEDYIEEGLDVAYDGTDITVTAGKAFVTDSSASLVQAAESRDNGVIYEIDLDARTLSPQDTSGMNYVFADVDLSSDDTVSVFVSTNSSPPADPSITLGVVDTANDIVGQPRERREIRANKVSVKRLIELGQTVTVESGDSMVIGGPVEGEGTITGEGVFKVV